MEQEKFEKAREKIIGINRERQGIGTLAEKTVHAVLKHYYAPDEDMHEIPIEGYVADIYTGKEIIEIQSVQFGKLRSKLDKFLPLYPVTICHPIPRNKWLIWIDEVTGELSNKRKAPRIGTCYHGFMELYQIKDYLKDPNLKIKFVLLDIEEYRLLDGWSKNKKRGSHRYDRNPTQLVEEVSIERVEDYMQFLPVELPQKFTTKEYAKVVKVPIDIARVTLNILYFMGAVERVGKKGNSYLYEVIEI